MVNKLPKIITQDEFEQIFKYTLKQKKRKPYAVAMLLGFEAGMRISEIVGLKSLISPDLSANIPALTKSNVDMQSNQIRIMGKGQKDRIVPLPKRFNNAALNLLPLKMSRRSLQRWVTNIGEKVLGKHITFHTLRHGFGSHLAGMGVPLHQVQMLMGHSRLDTTGIYLHANPKEAIERARDVF